MIACCNRKPIVNRFRGIVNLGIRFQRAPDFGVTNVNYDFADLLSRAEEVS